MNQPEYSQMLKYEISHLLALKSINVNYFCKEYYTYSRGTLYSIKSLSTGLIQSIEDLKNKLMDKFKELPIEHRIGYAYVRSNDDLVDCMMYDDESKIKCNEALDLYFEEIIKTCEFLKRLNNEDISELAEDCRRWCCSLKATSKSH